MHKSNQLIQKAYLTATLEVIFDDWRIAIKEMNRKIISSELHQIDFAGDIPNELA